MLYSKTTLPTIEFRTILLLVATCIVLMLITGYVVFQARFILIGPQIVMTSDLPVKQNARTITLTGTAHNITHLWLNDRQIFTDEAGNFEEALVLENGYTVATLKAKDRFGRETRVEQPFVYTPTSFTKQ